MGPPIDRQTPDHKTDPQENTNIAAAPEAKETVKKLSKLLQAGWKSIE